ncbi:DUF952 domain-containing protein [soil metagenome]
MKIYHIVTPEVWGNFKNKDFYEAESLQTEGFIHCSFADQLEGVLERYYSSTKKVLILTIEPEKLTSELINEPSTNDEIYPHIYGKINRDAIIDIKEREIEATN